MFIFQNLWYNVLDNDKVGEVCVKKYDRIWQKRDHIKR